MPITIARDVVREPLYAVVPYFNPFRSKARVKHTERALKHFHECGFTVVLVEVAFNRREFIFGDYGLEGQRSNCMIAPGEFTHQYIGLTTKDELWLKENAINIGVQHIPLNALNFCWLDSDVHFIRPNVVGECIHKLQHYKFLQMFSQAQDLAPNYETLPAHYPHATGVGFVTAWQNGWVKTTVSPEIQADLDAIALDIKKLRKDFQKLKADLKKECYTGRRVFPGLAWACTREAWEQVGGLLDIAVWGGGDWHMAHALIEKTDGMMLNELHRNYKKVVMQWYHRCKTHIRRNVGVMEGTIFHHWHGKKTLRGYDKKHTLLAELGFDPPRHLKRNSQGLWELHDDGGNGHVTMRDTLREIARERNEDSIDI